MADNETLRIAFTSLLNILESQQRQIDELIEKVNAIEGAASDIVEGFSARREDLAADISHYTQHRVAEKADIVAELRSQFEQLFP